MWLLVSMLWGCGSADCASRSGIDHDACLNDEIKATKVPSDVIRIAGTMQDPLVRDAAIIKWVEDHRRDLKQEDGKRLCAMLQQREGDACTRRLLSAHLSR